MDHGQWIGQMYLIVSKQKCEGRSFLEAFELFSKMYLFKIHPLEAEIFDSALSTQFLCDMCSM